MPVLSETTTRRDHARDVHAEQRLLRGVRGKVHGGGSVRADRRPRVLGRDRQDDRACERATHHPGNEAVDMQKHEFLFNHFL